MYYILDHSLPSWPPNLLPIQLHTSFLSLPRKQTSKLKITKTIKPEKKIKQKRKSTRKIYTRRGKHTCSHIKSEIITYKQKTHNIKTNKQRNPNKARDKTSPKYHCGLESAELVLFMASHCHQIRKQLNFNFIHVTFPSFVLFLLSAKHTHRILLLMLGSWGPGSLG